MVYKVRQDIVLEKISGIYMLIALRSAWKICPFAIQISFTSASFWKKIQEGKDSSAIIEEVSRERGLKTDKVSLFFDRFIRYAEEHHYIVKE